MMSFIKKPYFKDKKWRRSTIIFAFAAFTIGGFFGSVQLTVFNSISGSVGEIGVSKGIEEGMWFRYDLPNNMWIDNMVKYAGWTIEGGLPYLVIECTKVTTYDELGDVFASDGGSKKAYEWSITPYWQNGAEAKELLNGSVENDVWEIVMKPVYDGFNSRNISSLDDPASIVRPYVNRELATWANPIDATNVFNTYSNVISGYGGITDVTNTFTYVSVVENYKYSRSRAPDYWAFHDDDSGILFMVRVTDWWSGSGGQTVAMFMTGYGDNSNVVGKLPPTPPSISAFIRETVGQSYEYELVLQGSFQRAFINITTNDTANYPTIVNGIVTTNIIPLDIDGPVEGNISIIAERGGLLSEPFELLDIVLGVESAPEQIDAVTLLSVDQIGNSWNVSWTVEPNASQYRVMLNGTMFGEPVTSTNILIQPPEGDWNVTVICDSFIFNKSSNSSNGIVETYSIPVDEESPQNYAVDPDRTDIQEGTPYNGLAVVGIVLLSIIAAIVVTLWWSWRTGKLPAKKRKIRT